MAVKEALREELRAFAKEELGEDDETRERALQDLAKLLQQNPRITLSQPSDLFLLGYLRKSKFDVEEAGKMIEMLLLMKELACDKWMDKLHPSLPSVDRLISNGSLLLTPGRDKNGRRWFITRMGTIDFNVFSNVDLMMAITLVQRLVAEEEENQIRGSIFLHDVKDLSLQITTLFTPNEMLRGLKNIQKVLPVRTKHSYVVNIPPSLKFIVDSIFQLLDETQRNRFTFFSDFKELQDTVGNSALPKEYGGTVPMADMIEWLKKELAEKTPAMVRASARLELFSESERSEAETPPTRFLGDQASQPLRGTFRRLEVD